MFALAGGQQSLWLTGSCCLIGNRNRQVGSNKAIFLAHALDPRFKTLNLIRSDDNKEAIWKYLLQRMVEIGPVIDANKETSSSDNESDFREVSSRVASPRNPTSLSLSMAMLRSPSKSPGDSSVDSWREMCEDELKRYKGVKRVDFGSDQKTFLNYDPLEWWSENSRLFPTLWRLAKTYLAIPATSASAERAFSVAGTIVSAKRCNLDEQRVEDLHFVRENLWVLKENKALYHDYTMSGLANASL